MSAPVKHTCPDIDKVIKMVKSIQDVAKDGMKAHDKNSDDYERYKDVEWDTDSIIDKLEELRNSNSRLRDWGETLETEKIELEDQIFHLEEEVKTLKQPA